MRDSTRIDKPGGNRNGHGKRERQTDREQKDKAISLREHPPRKLLLLVLAISVIFPQPSP